MFCTIVHNKINYKADLSKPLDISIPFTPGKKQVNAYYAPPFRIEAVKIGKWIGEVKKGAPVNYRNININPHGNGTHTECVGHIIAKPCTINQSIKEFFFVAELITVQPEKAGNDYVITRRQIENLIGNKHLPGGALVLRTMPNSPQKLSRNYSGKNPPYLHHEAMSFIAKLGVNHLLVDLPSVDKEMDEGKLLAHKIFWEIARHKKHLSRKTITELIYVPQRIKDGTYLLNLQVAAFENDAAPSRPVLFKIIQQLAN